MAATAMQQQSKLVTAMNQSSNWHSTEGQCSNNGKVCQESTSTSSYSSGDTFTSRCDSNSPAYDYCSSSTNSDPTQHTKDLCSKTLTAESRYHDHRPPSEEYKTEEVLNPNSSSSSGTDIYSKKNKDVERSEFTSQKSTTQKHRVVTDDKKTSHRSNKFPISYRELQAKTLDDTIMKDSNTLSSITNPGHTCKQTHTYSSYRASMVPRRNTQDFEISELALKLRSSLQSDFLSNELRLWNPAKSEAHTSDSSDALRTIDEILKQYGISNNVPLVRTIAKHEDDVETIADCQDENSNISQNNETLSSFSETAKTKKKNDTAVSKSSENLDMPPTSAQKIRSKTSKKEHKVSSKSCRDNSRLTSYGVVGLRTNLSQNNETTETQNNVEDDMLRKYGSSVDYTIAGSAGKYSLAEKTNYGRYDYGKAFTGDNSASPRKTYPQIESKNFESSVNIPPTLAQQTEGSQVDIIKATESSRDPSYDIYRTMGSSTDALELSISTERQRLRRVDTLITAASVNTPVLHVPKALTTRFYSPQRELYNFKPREQIPIAYSNPSFSAVPYGVPVLHKHSWVGTSYKHEKSNFLGKSASAPGNWGFQSAGRYSSSIDSRNLPYSTNRDFNRQYNNSTNNQLQTPDKLAGQKNYNKNHTQISSKKVTTLDTNNRKKAHSSPIKPKNKEHLQCPLQTVSTVASSFDHDIYDKDLNGKLSCNKSVSTKKCGSTNINDSKNASSTYSGFDFIRTLNKIREETASMITSAANALHNQSLSKYSPYTSYMTTGARREDGISNLSKEVLKKDAASKSGKAKLNIQKYSSSAASTGRLHEYKSDSEFLSTRGCRGQDSFEQHSTRQDHNKKSNNSLEKKKHSIPPLLFTYYAHKSSKAALNSLSTKTNNPLFNKTINPLSNKTTNSLLGTTRPRSDVGNYYKS